MNLIPITMNPHDLSKLIENIYRKTPDAIIGGSIMLHTHKLLNREPNDIDVLIPDYMSISTFADPLGLTLDVTTESLSDTDIDVAGNKVQRIACKYKDIKICVFKVPTDQLVWTQEYVIVQKSGINYYYWGRLQSPMFCIEAKRQYLRKARHHDAPSFKKHLNDLIEIGNNMGIGSSLIPSEVFPHVST